MQLHGEIPRNLCQNKTPDVSSFAAARSLYTSLFRHIESKLIYIEERLTGAPCTGSLQVLTSTLESEIEKFYELFTKVEVQTKAFCSHFMMQLLSVCALGILYIVAHIFIILRMASSWQLEPVRLLRSLVFVLTAVLYGKNLYDLSTGGGQLTSAALDVANQLNNLDNAGSKRLSLQLRLDMQTVAMKIRTSPPLLDPGHYFSFNRKLLTTVRLKWFSQQKSVINKF